MLGLCNKSLVMPNYAQGTSHYVLITSKKLINSSQQVNYIVYMNDWYFYGLGFHQPTKIKVKVPPGNKKIILYFRNRIY